MRRPVIVLAVLAVLGAGILGGLVLYRVHQSGDIRGSSTKEFTLPTAPPRPRPQA